MGYYTPYHHFNSNPALYVETPYDVGSVPAHSIHLTPGFPPFDPEVATQAQVLACYEIACRIGDTTLCLPEWRKEWLKAFCRGVVNSFVTSHPAPTSK